MRKTTFLVALVLISFSVGCSQPIASYGVPVPPGSTPCDVAQSVEGAAYFLPRKKIPITVTGVVQQMYDEKGNLETGPQWFSAAIGPAIVEPDPNHLMRVTYRESQLSDDDIDIQIGANGLLDLVTTKFTDQSGAILLKLLEAAVTLHTGLAAGPGGPSIEFDANAMTLTTVYSGTFDPTDDLDTARMHKVLTRYGITLSVDRLAQVHRPQLSRGVAGRVVSNTCGLNGIAYRPQLPYRIRLDAKSPVPHKDHPGGVEKVVLLPNEAPIVYFPIDRASFVAKVTNLDFDDGILLSAHVTKPSELMAFVSIPLEAAKQIASIPAQIIQLKINRTGKQTDLLSGEKQLAEQQLQLLQALEQLQEALAEGRPAVGGPETGPPAQDPVSNPHESGDRPRPMTPAAKLIQLQESLDQLRRQMKLDGSVSNPGSSGSRGAVGGPGSGGGVSSPGSAGDPGSGGSKRTPRVKPVKDLPPPTIRNPKQSTK